jgi:hypothetical protein
VYADVDVAQVGMVESKTLDAVFARIDDAILPTSDKSHLKFKVAAFSQSVASSEHYRPFSA